MNLAATAALTAFALSGRRVLVIAPIGRAVATQGQILRLDRNATRAGTAITYPTGGTIHWHSPRGNLRPEGVDVFHVDGIPRSKVQHKIDMLRAAGAQEA